MPVGHPKQKNLIFTDEILLLIDWCFPKTNKYYFNYAHTLIFVRRYVSLKKSSFINSFIGVNQGNEIENATKKINTKFFAFMSLFFLQIYKIIYLFYFKKFVCYH